MASMETDNGDTDDIKGSMWVLDQKIDQPMDEEAGRLRNMYREKVWFNSFFFIPFSSLFLFFSPTCTEFNFISFFLRKPLHLTLNKVSY